MSAEAAESNLESLVARLAAAESAPIDASEAEVRFAGDTVLAQLLRAMMAWEAGEALAQRAIERLHESFVDANELRVCLPDEMSLLLGSRYPRGHDRCERLRHTLNAIFQQENTTSLSHLRELPKREARQYLEQLDGMPRYVAARVTLLALGGHALPLDDRLRQVLEGAGVRPEVADTDDLGNWVERRIRVGEAEAFYRPLEGLAEAESSRSGAARKVAGGES